MHVKHAVAGGLTGLMVAALGYFGYTIVTQAQSAVRAEAITVVEPPAYTSTRDVFEALHPTCVSFRRVQTLGSELDAATCSLDGKTARIGLYETSSDLQDTLRGSKGVGAYGNRLTVVAGRNWSLAVPSGEGTSALADQVADKLHGRVVFR
ncbi:hypothetical protein AB0K16_22000 [Nonomuraea jabiensis]|uniref:hypothetical protein n=1 Tax=Nonomuraea jabiensis TaxID=882448 RepID=UPI0034342D69